MPLNEILRERPSIRTPIILVVGDLRRWQLSGRAVPALDGFHFAKFADLGRNLLRQVGPDVVLSPLVSARFDALDLALRLSDLGFMGRYRAISVALPDPGAICREVAQLVPDLDFDLFLIDETGLPRPQTRP